MSAALIRLDDIGSGSIQPQSDPAFISPESQSKPNVGFLNKNLQLVSTNNIYNELQTIFYNSRNEIFEDGMNSIFSESLKDIIKNHSKLAIEALEKILSDDNININVTEEALLQISNINDDLTYHNRLDLLKSGLSSSYSRIRCTAAIGIENMDDKNVIGDLQNAIDNEKNTRLKEIFKEALNTVEVQMK